jgi:hypothetical protein
MTGSFWVLPGTAFSLIQKTAYRRAAKPSVFHAGKRPSFWFNGITLRVKDRPGGQVKLTTINQRRRSMYHSTYNRESELGRDQLLQSGLDFWRSGPSVREAAQPDAAAWEAASPIRVTPGRLGLVLLTAGLLLVVFVTAFL